MKIPMPDLPDVKARPVEQGYSNLNLNDGTDALVKGLGQAVDGVGGMVQKIRADADATAADSLFAQAQEFTTNQLHGYDEAPKADEGPAGYDTLTEEQINSVGNPGEHVPGFLDTRGTQAYEQAGDVTDRLKKKYDGLMAVAGSDGQRKIFGKRIEALKASVHQQIAVHEGQQRRVAQVAATNALLDTTIRTAAAMYDQDALLAPVIGEALSSMKRTVLPEEYEAKKAEYLGRVAKVMIGKYLEAGDVAGAEQRYALDEKVLGEDGGNVKKLIIAKKEAQQADQDEFQGQVVALRTAERLRNAHGFVEELDENKLRNEIETQYPERKKIMGPIVARQIQVEGERRDAVIRSWVSEARQLRRDGGGSQAIGAELKTKLGKFKLGQDYLDGIEGDDERHQRRSAARRAGGADAKKANKAQADANRLALKRFKTLPFEEQANYEQTKGFEGMGLNDEGKADLGIVARQAKNFIGKGFNSAREKIDNESDEAVRQSLIRKGKPLGSRYDFKAGVAEDLATFLEKNDRAPDPAERTKIISDNLLKDETKPRPDLLGLIPRGPEPEYEFERKKREREELSRQTEGKVVVRSGAKRKAVPAGQVDAWLKSNAGWSK